MTSSTGNQIIAIHILFKISRNKDNQTVKFGQLKKCDSRNIFLSKIMKKRENRKALYAVSSTGQYLSFNLVLNLNIQ